LGVGDLLLGARGLLFEQGPRGVSVGASFTATVPLGDRAFVNESGAGFEPRVSARYDARRFGFGVRFGYRMRTATSLYGTALDDEVTFALGGDARLFRTTRALAEIAGATAAQGDVFARRLTPVEALFGARRHLGRFSVAAGAGPGLVSGYGAPQFRALLSVAWQSVAPDADRDAVPDEHDRCPDDPEDRDGFEDGDGCPDPDDDADGIPDGDDRCPRDAEDLDGFEDLDGCPDPDNDGDGVPDATDRCPEELETPNGWQDDDGCADEIPDTDGDGILDNSDQCPNEAEDKDGFEDEDGCPDPDNDGDGVADAEDKCPTEAETINGNQDDDGCPDEGVAQVKLGEKELETLRPVFFKTDRSRIRRAFWSILDQVALMLKAHPEIGRCAVEGHADATGPDVWNQRLSVLRAESVVEYLVGKGVARQRLSAIGQGESKPWADNATEEGRTKNRRVVFHIEGVER
jgi:outer membrane protein OmpA-like peptidoglycan-associated protein